jgi:uncharacterized membrane protein
MSTTTNTAISYENGIKTHAIIAYVLLLVGLFTAIPLLIGAIWAMVKKKSARGTLYHSHYMNATRVFWWTVFWSIIGFLLVFVLIGYAILGLVWLWALYRVVDGFAKITSDLAYPL